jgi:KUP system potassium uptake protein
VSTGFGSPSANTSAPPPPGGRHLLGLCLGATGVVYGDIGTSPIYAVRQCFHPFHGVAPSPESVLGVLSLIFWSLVLSISTKYLFLVMRADNNGEGGIIALTVLVNPPSRAAHGARRLLVLTGLFGAALLYGDSMITPAISVLAAVEGLEVATPVFHPFILPLTALILVALFSAQSRGTARLGALFGPIMVLWFLTIAVLGASELIRQPAVLAAIYPGHALRFFADHRLGAFLVLGAVFLVVTGGEALYADMGHFGRRPIRLAWFCLVFPSLLLNYFGQGALILRNPAAAAQPFFLMAPSWALYPLVALCTAATVIASQAVISGAFSLTHQAVQLGYLPRLRVEHTSVRQIGQIYLPAVNGILLVACLALVLGFESSSHLAGAYGVAVTTQMIFTTILFIILAWRAWGWSPVWLVLLAAVFLSMDFAFWSASLHKIPHGGWFPLLVAGAIFTLMTTWKTGRQILAARLLSRILPIDLFVADVRNHPPFRVPGTAVFLDSNPDGTPPALLHNFKHNRVLHERVVFLTIEVQGVPYVAESQRFESIALGEGLHRLRIRVGFAEEVDVPALLRRCTVDGTGFDPMQTSFFLGRERLIASGTGGMAPWRQKLFAAMSHNAQGITPYFRLPPNRVVELGMQLQI